MAPLDQKKTDASLRQVMALTTDQLVVNAATHGTEKTQPKPKNPAGVDKGKGRGKKTTMGDEQLRMLADTATRQLQGNADHTTGGPVTEMEGPQAVESGDDEQPLPSQTQPTDTDMTAGITRKEFQKIRATDEYQVPPFGIAQHLKNDTIQISIPQLLQIAPSIRQQLSSERHQD
ncbi:uncharacterized protein FFNC_15326 [Fusarium fujikuroi]|nr:uncharacterized protein FFE2_15965 [Fusarium fujikuroi]SCO54075.1 uncharacterized protein FFNC_15326 [Fusarium fujikuroi]